MGLPTEQREWANVRRNGTRKRERRSKKLVEFHQKKRSRLRTRTEREMMGPANSLGGEGGKSNATRSEDRWTMIIGQKKKNKERTKRSPGPGGGKAEETQNVGGCG